MLPLSAVAQERITLSEVVPSLEETELGEIEVGEAPSPGMSRIVSRGEVLSALRKAGRSAKGLEIPRATKISRKSRQLRAAEVDELVLPALREALAPCEVKRAPKLDAITVPKGDLSVRVEAHPPARSGNAFGVLVIEMGDYYITRTPLRVPVDCPPPLVLASSPVRIVVKVGNVIASAPGKALQAGRLNELVSVTRTTDGARVRARVIGSATVEAMSQ